MRFHPKGVIALVVILPLALAAGALPAVGILRLLVVLFAVVALGEIVVNMIRHRDTRVRSRLLGSLFVPARLGPNKD